MKLPRPTGATTPPLGKSSSPGTLLLTKTTSLIQPKNQQLNLTLRSTTSPHQLKLKSLRPLLTYRHHNLLLSHMTTHSVLITPLFYEICRCPPHQLLAVQTLFNLFPKKLLLLPPHHFLNSLILDGPTASDISHGIFTILQLISSLILPTLFPKCSPSNLPLNMYTLILTGKLPCKPKLILSSGITLGL